jgi:cysteine desulfurase
MIKPDPLYFDYSASAPPYEEALEQFKNFSLQYPANPSSFHSSGKEAGRKLLELKMSFCNRFDFNDGHLLLCSSATEANNTIVEGHRRRFPRGRIVIAEDVHDSIWYATRKHAEHTDVLPLKEMEDLSMAKLNTIFPSDTSLVCINQVCNETGRIHPLKTIAEFCLLRDIRLLVDGSQAVGHIPVSLKNIPCDYYSFSAHKFGGPRSMGGVLIRDRQFEPLLSGGKQEWELRAGTENLPGLAAALVALDLELAHMNEEINRLNHLKTKLLLQLESSLPELMMNTPENGRPGFLSLSFPGFQGNEIVAAMSLSGFKIAMGSACHADRTEPSRIILATGRSESEAAGTIRISMGRGNSEESVEQLGLALLSFIGS